MLELINVSSTITFSSSTHDNPSSALAIDQIDTDDKVNINSNTSNLFECPEEGCTRSYMKYGNLMRHLAIGDHEKQPEKITLIDTAKKLYHSKLSAAENKRVISLSIEHIMFDASNFDRAPIPKLGWALPTTNPPIRFNIKQKQFLQVNNFQE